MKKDSIKLYNVIFPIWFLWLIPITWVVVLPANFIIDLLVTVLTMKSLKIQNIKNNVKAAILRIWVFGFLADFIGTFFMFSAGLIDINNNHEWWYQHIISAVNYNPFDSIYAVLWVSACVIIAAGFIYFFNIKFCLKKTDLDVSQKKALALSLAIFTAPYLFYLPTAWFF